MKEDTPGNHEDRMLPILDTKMAVVGGQIINHHYTKPMASLEVTMEISAIYWFKKVLEDSGICALPLPGKVNYPS